MANPVDPQHLPELRFYNFSDDDYYTIQINKFEVTRNVQRRFLYQYDIQMTALRRLLQPSRSAADALNDLLDQVPSPASISLWQTLLQGYSAVYGGMANIINTVTGIEQNINMVASAVSAFKQGTTDLIACPVGLLRTTIAAVDSILAKTVDITAIPFEFTNDLRNTKRSMLQLSLRADLFSDTSATAGAVTSTNAPDSTEIMTAPLPQNAAAQGIVAMNIPESSLFDPSLESSAEVAASEQPVGRDDTISTIAQKTLGDATAWMRIARLNDLEYPFIVQRPIDAFSPALGTGTLAAPADAGTQTIIVSGLAPSAGEILLLNDGTNWEPTVAQSVDSVVVTIQAPLQNSYAQGASVTRHERALSVLLPGDKVQIPGGSSTGAAIVTGDNQADFYAKIFGTDEHLDDEGAHSADPSGDAATVSGLDNLGMALQHRLRTTRGELAALGHPQYGSYLPQIVGKISSQMWYQRAILEAKITIMEDPRVATVGTIRFQAEGSAIYLDVDVYPVNQTAATKMSILVG